MSDSYQLSKKFERLSFKALPKAIRNRKRIAFPQPKKVSLPIKNYVSRAISRNVETKCSMRQNIADQQTVTGAGLNTSVGLGFVSGTSIIPAISQGTGEAERVGNKIKPTKLKLAITLRAQPVTAVGSLTPFPATPFLCRVIVFRHRYATDDNSQIGILDTGNSMSNLGSTPDSWLQPYNKDEYIIAYSKQFLMQPIQNQSTTPYSAENMVSNAKAFVMLKKNIKVPKSLIYTDNTSTANNAGWFLAVACCNVDGTVVTNTQSRVMLNAESYLYYKDA